jgi:Leucine-rich repeat (LRR) protein
MARILQRQHWRNRILAIPFVLLLSIWPLTRTQSSQNINQATPDPKVKAEWVSTGFKFGWMNVDNVGTTYFRDKEATGGLPSFRSSANYKGENLTTLPPIKVPFGLFLDHPLIRDKFLQGLARFQQVRFLCLRYAGITDSGMKEIGQLKDLTHLEISHSPNTELGEPADAKGFNHSLKQIAVLTKLEVLNLSQTKINDSGIENLGKMKRLRVLNLYQTKTTDAGLKKISDLKSLQVLELIFAPVTQKGIKELAELPELTSLSVGGPTITDAEVTEFAKLPELKSLQIVMSKVGRDGFKSLAGLEKLQSLELVALPVNNDDLQELTSLKQLRSLSLAGTTITDTGLRIVGTLKHLRYLSLAGTKITNAGLDALIGLTDMTTLDVRETMVTNDGTERLKKALPKVIVLAGKG